VGWQRHQFQPLAPTFARDAAHEASRMMNGPAHGSWLVASVMRVTPTAESENPVYLVHRFAIRDIPWEQTERPR
jgi:hypothetical protein